MTAEFRPGIPAFVQVYDRLRELIARDGLEPGERLPSEVMLAGELGITRELVRESLLPPRGGRRTSSRDWAAALVRGRTARAQRIGFARRGSTASSGGAVPVRRLHAAVEGGSTWSHELLRTEERTPRLGDRLRASTARLLASALELMPESALPDDVVGATDAEQRDVERWPTLLDALDPVRRAAMTPDGVAGLRRSPPAPSACRGWSCRCTASRPRSPW